MNIGITLGIQKEYESMWVNGIKLNAILLANALNQISGVSAYILDTSNKIEDLTKVMWDYTKFPVKRYQDAYKDTDLLITLGTSLPVVMLDEFRKTGNNKKVVKYQCGNSYVIDMERAIFPKEGQENVKAPWDGGADQVWYVPQQGYQNHDYYKVVYKTEEVYPVPFVWDPMFLDRTVEAYKRTNKAIPKYIPGKDNKDKKLNVFEPNMNVVKYSMIPILMAEEAYRQGIEYDQLFVSSGNRILKNGYFKSAISTLSGVHAKPKPKFQFTSRYPITHYLANSADIVLSHQWENPLNYAYLDVMYFNYPLVHNADMIKDAGYYYPDFEILKGVEQLKFAIEEHDDNLEAYREKNQKVLDRYTIKNKEMVETYKKLLDNLFGYENHEMSYEYDWKTNVYK